MTRSSSPGEDPFDSMAEQYGYTLIERPAAAPRRREPVPDEPFTGPDRFAQRCLELGRISGRLIEAANTELGEMGEDPNLFPLGDYQPDFKVPALNAVTLNYSRHLMAINQLRATGLDNKELFSMAFGKPSYENIDTTWMAGGLVFWCLEPDYTMAFIGNRSESIVKATRKARDSVAVACGMLYMDATGENVPVAVVKVKYDQQKTFIGPEVPPEPVSLEEVDSILIKSTGYDASCKDWLMQARDKDGQDVLRLISTNFEDDSETTKDFPIAKDTPITLKLSSYRMTYLNGQASFSFADNPAFYDDESELALVYESFDRKGRIKELVKSENKANVEHELQHLVNSLYEPRRYKKSDLAPKHFSTPGVTLRKISQLAIKKELDPAIRDEVLAQLIGQSRSVGETAAFMAGQVKDMGTAYDYLPAHIDAVAKMVRASGLFENTSQAAYSVMSEVAGQYGDHISKTMASVANFEGENHGFNRQELVALLAPHPFHTWPTVLRAVARLKSNNPS